MKKRTTRPSGPVAIRVRGRSLPAKKGAIKIASAPGTPFKRGDVLIIGKNRTQVEKQLSRYANALTPAQRLRVTSERLYTSRFTP